MSLSIIQRGFGAECSLVILNVTLRRQERSDSCHKANEATHLGPRRGIVHRIMCDGMRLVRIRRLDTDRSVGPPPFKFGFQDRQSTVEDRGVSSNEYVGVDHQRKDRGLRSARKELAEEK